MNLRKAAKGEPCEIRVPGVCIDSAPEHATVVACHVRVRGAAGIGQKPIDILSARGCIACHDYCDARTHKKVDPDFRRLMLLEGLVSTLLALNRAGYELTKTGERK